MSVIEVTPAELQAAGARLQRVGGNISAVGGSGTRGAGAGGLGSPALEQAVTEFCDQSLAVTAALWNAVNLTGANLIASSAAYHVVDSRSMRYGRP